MRLPGKLPGALMKCKVARELAQQWYETHDEMDKVAYLQHRRTCAFCKIEFIRECKRMERDETDYDDEVIGL